MNTTAEEEQIRLISSLPVLVTVEECAFILRTTVPVVRRLISGRELASVNMDGETRVTTAAIQAFSSQGLRQQLQAQLRALDTIDAESAKTSSVQ
jgi:hypothetical protein